MSIDSLLELWKKNKPEVTPTPPAPTPEPMPPTPEPEPTPVPVTSAWRGCQFVPATKGMPNNQGVSSQQAYRGCHGKSNENAIRVDMLQCVKNWGGNWLIYIRGEFCRNNVVLDMCLNGRIHPTENRYLPIKNPLTGEADWAMWGREKYGIDKHLCFIWNDNNSVPYTEAIVKEAVESYNGTRLGMENVMFGTCLETNEQHPDPNTAVKMLGWIAKYAPNSPRCVGSAKEDYLMAVSAKDAGAFLWLEQAPSLLANPLTRSTFPAYLASLNRLAAKYGKARVIPGEWWMSSPADVKWATEQLLAEGFTVLGMGKYL